MAWGDGERGEGKGRARWNVVAASGGEMGGGRAGWGAMDKGMRGERRQCAARSKPRRSFP